MTDAELLAALATAKDPYLRVLGRLGLLQQERGAQYNTGGVQLADYFPLGRVSYYQMVHVKALRMRSTMTNNQATYVDSIMDLINYAIFAAMAEEHNNG
jgi:hypothetical protein